MFDLQYLPQRVNSGRWVTAYTLYHLRDLPAETCFVLPIVPLGTSLETLLSSDVAESDELLLPPLFREALDGDLEKSLLDRIWRCFPSYASPETNRQRLRVVRVPDGAVERKGDGQNQPVDVLAFSVDTAVEEHGPHLPLATDTLQSYSVLQALVAEFDQREDSAKVVLGPPLEYGQLTWGLPFGFSVDVTAPLLTQYVTRYVDALQNRLQPTAIYVVDVHGSIVHREAIVAGLQDGSAERWAFRWLHEPLAEFSSARNDQHAGGVETALVERIDRQLVDSAWWPERFDEIEQHQMSLSQAVELTSDLDRFIREVQERGYNGIVGGIENYPALDADDLFRRMVDVGRRDIEALLQGESVPGAGPQLW